VYDVTVTSHTKDVLIASIKGINSRDDVERLRNIELCVPRSSLPEADENEYYYEDLVGLKVTLADGSPYGTISGVHNFGAGDLVTIKLPDNKDELFPFTRATFPSVNIKEGIVVIEPPAIIAHD